MTSVSKCKIGEFLGVSGIEATPFTRGVSPKSIEMQIRGVDASDSSSAVVQSHSFHLRWVATAMSS